MRAWLPCRGVGGLSVVIVVVIGGVVSVAQRVAYAPQAGLLLDAWTAKSARGGEESTRKASANVSAVCTFLNVNDAAFFCVALFRPTTPLYRPYPITQRPSDNCTIHTNCGLYSFRTRHTRALRSLYTLPRGNACRT